MKEHIKKNYVFDDLQDEFNSKGKDFVVTSNDQPITGITTFNAVVTLINGLFQNPTDDYNLAEISGDTSSVYRKSLVCPVLLMTQIMLLFPEEEFLYL